MKRIGKVLVGILGSSVVVAGMLNLLYNRSNASSNHEIIQAAPASYAHSQKVSFNTSSELKSIPDKIYYQNKVVIVTFHDISPDVYSQYVITPSQFSADLDAIVSRFDVITNQQFISFLNDHGTVPPNAVLITFDDGYRNMYTYALPILLQHHLQGTFFEIVGTADKNASTRLTWSQIKTMVGDGMVFESHTYNSHYKVRDRRGKMVPAFDTRMTVNGKLESLSHYNVRVYGDFLKARTELSREIGEPVTQFAWPYGWGTAEATYIAERVGYRDIYTTKDGYVSARTNPLFIPRIDIGKPWIDPVEELRLIIHFSTVSAGFSGWISSHLPENHHHLRTNKLQQLAVNHQSILKTVGSVTTKQVGSTNNTTKQETMNKSNVFKKGGTSSLKKLNVTLASGGSSKNSSILQNKSSGNKG